MSSECQDERCACMKAVTYKGKQKVVRGALSAYSAFEHEESRNGLKENLGNPGLSMEMMVKLTNSGADFQCRIASPAYGSNDRFRGNVCPVFDERSCN